MQYPTQYMIDTTTAHEPFAPFPASKHAQSQSHHDNSTTTTSSMRLQPPQSSSAALPFYTTSSSLTITTSDIHTITTTTGTNTCDSPISPISPLSPRTLYAQSFLDHHHHHSPTFTFERPHSVQRLPPAATRPATAAAAVGGGRFRKNLKDITGFVTTEEEFEALPVAVRRKYFSTLERLQIARSSRSNALNEVRLPIQRPRKSSIADRRGLNAPVIEPPRRKPSNSRRLRKVARQQSIADNEVSWYLTLPEKIKRKEFTREAQVVLAGHLGESVILDAADEALYKASRRACRTITPMLDSASPATTMTSTESHRSGNDTTSTMAETMYESFRWMDEEEDLDLKLVLDDYHANLDGFVLPTPNSHPRPSFRRTMSISKMPFGRNSLSTIQPQSPKFEPNTSHTRQKSRALSLIGPRHGRHDSISSIDPNATHYQDPEARLKLRVYLASPQKFDEAIEFGFPSMDGMAEGADKENKPPKRSSKDVTGRKPNPTDGMLSSFLNDEAASLFEDDASMVDPESPLTPMGLDLGLRPGGVSSPTYTRGSKTSADFSHLIPKPTLVKQPDSSYAQSMPGSREMTLRMTLTRPDLRADETTLYGWQTSTSGTKSPLREEPLSLDGMEDKFEVRGPLGGPDGWGPIDKENGVVRRFWNRVKSQRK